MTKRMFSLVLFFVLQLVFSLPLLAQLQESKLVPNLPRYETQSLRFGFYLGGDMYYLTPELKSDFSSTMYYEGSMDDISADSARVLNVYGEPGIGLAIGMVTTYQIADYLTVRFVPGLLFGERTLNYDVETYKNAESAMLYRKKKVVSTYLDFPLHIKYSAMRMHNFRPFVIAGAAVKYDLSAQGGKEDETSEVLVKLKPLDATLEIGTGFDYFMNWSKFSVQLKASFGMNNILYSENTIYSGPLSALHGKMFQVVVTFE